MSDEASNWARKLIEELEEERDSLRQQLKGAEEENQRLREMIDLALRAALRYPEAAAEVSGLRERLGPPAGGSK